MDPSRTTNGGNPSQGSFFVIVVMVLISAREAQSGNHVSELGSSQAGAPRGSQTDASQNGTRGVTVELRKDALSQFEIDVARCAKGGGAPGYVRSLPSLQRVRQKPSGEVDAVAVASVTAQRTWRPSILTTGPFPARTRPHRPPSQAPKKGDGRIAASN